MSTFRDELIKAYQIDDFDSRFDAVVDTAGKEIGAEFAGALSSLA